MEQIVSEISGRVLNILTVQITKHIGYVRSSTKHVANMSAKMKRLESKRDEVKKHKEENNRDMQEIPDRVELWLQEVDNVKNVVESISSINGIGCLDMKMRYRTGKKALKTIEVIDGLTTEEISWSNAIIPLGRVGSKSASMSAPSPWSEVTQIDFKSRDKAFNEALKYLQEDNKDSRVIALCGMGGVGKTTMMEQLKKVAEDNKMFGWIVKVVIGQNPHMLSIQTVTARYIGCDNLPEYSRSEDSNYKDSILALRADLLNRRFKKLSQDKEKVLVVLDDVWKKIELKDIGLSPLPNGVKLFLTSRDSNICKQIATSGLQLVRVDVLEEAEAQNFFSQFAGVSLEDDHDKYQIGCDIVKKCGRLPLAIKIIASTLNSQEDYVWTDTLTHLKNYDFDDAVQKIIKISYEHIKDDEVKEIFLHCGLFPEDSNIPIEDLTRHAWGLKLLKNVNTFREARERVYTCVRKLINASLLIDVDRLKCVKMHDLVLAFVLGYVSKCGINETSDSCKNILLTCRDVCVFPRDLKYPKLSRLQLINEDLSPKFREDYYKSIENLKVIACYEMQYPLLPTSLENLKTLCLHECKLKFDCSFVGELVNLEVLSFSHCGIRKLPSAIGNLTKLKLLDLTGCVELHIDDGAFNNKENLEELYMSVSNGKAIRFTDANLKQLEMLSKHLSALEVEFVEEVAQLKNVCFTKLHKFKIAIGSVLESEYNERLSFKNTLKLVTDRFSDLLDCRIDVLFKNTEKLHLQVKDMIRVEDIVSVHPRDQRLFCKLRELQVCNCDNLKYLFPMSVASGLTKLERLKISSCPFLETLVQKDYGNEINSLDEMVKFEELKFLSLENLPKLVSLFLIDNVVELPQLVELEVDGLPNFTSIYHDKNNIPALLNSQVRVSELKKLKIKSMENLKQIWDVLPTNRMQLLNNLERLMVDSCGSIKVIFNVGMVKMKGGENIRLEKLQLLSLTELPKLEGLFLVDNVVELPQLVELEVEGLPFFTSIYPHKNNSSESQQPFFNSQVKVTELKKLSIRFMEKLEQIWPLSNESSDEDANNISMLSEIWVKGCENLVNLFPTNPMRLLKNLERLEVSACGSIEEIFNIDLGCVGHDKSKLKRIQVEYSEKLKEVWRIKGGENNSSSLLIYNFEAVETIIIYRCKSFRTVFTPTNTTTITKFGMPALTDITIFCSPDGQEEEVQLLSRKERHDDISAAVAFPSNLMHSFHNLQELSMIGCNGVEVVFEIENSPTSRELVTTTNNQQPLHKLQVLRLNEMKNMNRVWKCNTWNKFSLNNLTTITLWRCNKIKYLLSPLMAKLLSNLKTIDIDCCHDMEEVVSKRDDKTEEEVTTSTTSFFRHLHSLTFRELENLKRIGGGCAKYSTTSINHDQFESSHVTVVPWSLCICSREILIVECESLVEVFETQEMNNRSDGGITSTATIERNGGANNTSLAISRPERIHVPRLSNLMKLVINYCDLLHHVFTFSTLESLMQLEELMIKNCKAMKIIVKKENEEQIKDVEFRGLKSLELHNLPNLEGFFLGINKFQWPSLEKVMFKNCPKMMVFTSGQSTTPELKYIHTSLGKHSLECDLDSYVAALHQTNLPTSESTSSERLPAWSFHNLIELHTKINRDRNIKCIIPYNAMLQLQKLERIDVDWCSLVEEVFEVEAMEGPNSEQSQTVIQIPELREVDLKNLNDLKFLWKSTHHVLEFPKLTTLSIWRCRSLKYVFTSSMIGGLQTLPNLTTLSIESCESLEHVFTSSMVGSLQKLQDLDISECRNLKVIVKQEEEFESGSKVKPIVTFPCLKSLKLVYLQSLEGFWLGKDDFPFPSLVTLEIIGCPELRVFAKGHK